MVGAWDSNDNVKTWSLENQDKTLRVSVNWWWSKDLRLELIQRTIWRERGVLRPKLCKPAHCIQEYKEDLVKEVFEKGWTLQEFENLLLDQPIGGLKDNHGIDSWRALVIVRRVLVEWWGECLAGMCFK